ncbi:hypothetical protein MKX01_040973 [Papaver californicum]|nr:hypothetical protein MKX01_040973 [Papaver californicum]
MNVISGSGSEGEITSPGLKASDDTKAGVKGLVGAGVKNIPRIFLRQPMNLGGNKKYDAEHRKKIIHQIRDASENWGFFQAVNHGVLFKFRIYFKFFQNVMDEIIDQVRVFHEQPSEVNAINFDLSQAPNANWRESYFCLIAPDLADPEAIPTVLRDIVMEYSKYVSVLGSELLELLSEGLGLNRIYLNKDLDGDKGQHIVCHYYLECPQPELTMDHNASGLQVLHQNQWVDVPSSRGTFTVNIGDLLQESNIFGLPVVLYLKQYI